MKIVSGDDLSRDAKIENQTIEEKIRRYSAALRIALYSIEHLQNERGCYCADEPHSRDCAGTKNALVELQKIVRGRSL